MTAIEPFGTGDTSDIPVQKFMGATVAKFNCSVDYASQPGSCSISLVQDDTDGDLFVPGVIGSPQFFKIIDVNNNTIFEFNGVLESISRNTSATDKSYTILLVSALKILEAVTIILDGYTGYGQTIEGLPQFYSEDGYYNISESDKQNGYLPDGVTMTPAVDYFKLSNYSFATNNANLAFTGMWGRVFNLINVFAAYENEAINLTSYAGFGGSSSVKGGMRVDKIAYAIDQIVNYTSASSPKRYIGGNILYGTNTYNVCGTASGYVQPFPYWYAIDIIGFVQNLLYYLPEDYIVSGPSITLAEFIATVCDAVNADFIVELDNPNYTGGTFIQGIEQTYPNTIFGGYISIVILPKNEYVNCNAPFSKFTYDLLNLERSDMGDYEFAGNINPGQRSSGVVGNPLDLDYINRGTEGSYPYGGKFPTGQTTDSRGNTYSSVRATSIDLALKASPGTVGKMVVGGFQSRMNVVPRDFIYQYWGDISFTDKALDSCGINTTSQKSVPVITQILPPNDTWDWIAIDMQDIFSNKTVPGIIYKGIYFASMMEIRAAMSGRQEWDGFLYVFKKGKKSLLEGNIFKTLSNIPNIKYSGTVSKYASYFNLKVGSISPKGGNTTSVANSFNSVIDSMFGKIANIGNTHYGQSWVAPLPLSKTTNKSAQDNMVGSNISSWDLSDSAYVEPYAFNSMNAPKDSTFINDGRLKAFVNFEHSFPGDSGVGYDVISKQLTGFLPGVNYKYDFSEYGKNVVYDFDPDLASSGTCPLVGMAHVEPNIDSNILYLPSGYFSYYNRGHCPFIDNVDADSGIQTGQFFCYTYAYLTKGASEIGEMYESIVNDPEKKTFIHPSFTQSMLSFDVKDSGPTLLPVYYPCSGYNTISHSCETGEETFWDSSKTVTLTESGLSSGAYDAFYAWSLSGSAFYDVVNNLLETKADSWNGIPFVKFTTNKVYYPSTMTSAGVNPLSAQYLDSLGQAVIEDFLSRNEISEGALKLDTSGFDFNKNGVSKPCVAPHSIGIPQQSNRYVYGPWLTNYDNIIYAGKMEFEVDESLVPENFLIPVYGTENVNWQVKDSDGSVTRVVQDINGTVLSGFAGLNLAGQAIANSIDNFSLFAQEEGSVTIQGLPLITKLGQFLFDGPRITDLNISFDNNQVSTTYNFRSLTPRYGKSDRELLKKLRKVSNTVKTKGSK